MSTRKKRVEGIEIELIDPACKPHAESADAAGMDLRARIEHPTRIGPGEVRLIPAGFKMALPPGTFAMVCPRSGLALKQRITVLNAPGIIDADYRGEVGVLLYNAGTESYTVRPRDRVAQLLIVNRQQLNIMYVHRLSPTERGEGGFGSTGVA